MRAFSDTRRRSLLEASKDWDLEDALDALTEPLGSWINYPQSAGKKGVITAYEKLPEKARKALSNDVLATVQQHHGGSTFTAYRRLKGGSEVLGGLDSVTTDRGSIDYLDPAQWREYTIKASEVLVHWGQDTPLRSSQFKHEKEVILKPGVSIRPVKTERVFSDTRRRALVEAVGPSASEFVSEFLKRHPKLVPVVRSRHLDFVDTTSTKRGEAWQEGEHKIVLSPKFWVLASDRDRDAVLAHEVGHAVLAQYGLSAFIKLTQEHGIDVWDSLPFAQGNMEEAFSDAFAEYFLNPSELKRRYEAWFELVKALT